MEIDCPLRILFVEDLPSDAELAENVLRKDRILFTSKRVDTKGAFLKALEEFRPDLIISDYAMPNFDGMQALKLSLAHDPHLPFIIFTGSMNEVTAVACMKAGAADYIIKDHMTRLPSAVLGAIEQQKIRLEKDKTTEELMAIYENAPLLMMLVDGERRLHKVNGYAAAFSGRSTDAMRLMRCGEALRCSNALASPEGCGFGEQCEQCLIRRNVTDTLSTGRSHHLVEGSLPYRSDQREGKMIFLLSSTKLNIGKQCLVLVSLLDITERKQAEEELRASEERFKTIFHQSPLGMALMDSMTGRICMANQIFDKITRRTTEEATPIDWMSITHPDDVRETLDNVALLNAGAIDGFRKQIRFLRPDDSIVWVNMTVAPLSVEDKLYPQHLCIIEDITERRQVEKDLKESEEKYRELYDFLPIPVYEMDLKANITSANRATYETFRGTEKDLKAGFNAWQLLSPEHSDKSKKNITRLLKGEKIEDTEYTLKRMDGSTFPAIVILRLTYRNGKPFRLKGAIVDITERKRVEEELESERALLRSLIDNVPDLIYAKDSEGRFIICNEAMIRHMGMTSMTELMGKSDFDFLPLEMAQQFRADEQAVIQSGKSMINHEEPLAIEGGTITRWNLATKVPLLDIRGNLIGIVGVGREITDRKEAEKRLQDTLESLRKAVGVTIQVMGSVVETRDPYTAGHQTRSADLARAIATEMGLPHDKIDGIRMAGSIHDIGKLSIPVEILSKPTELSKNEFALIKEHACQGHKILKHVESPWPLAEMVYQHHERMDGSGYPRHLKGNDILMGARILAIADVVEAMASHRPYRPALGLNVALEEIENNKGTLYDTDAADACLRLFREKGFQLEGI